MDPKLVNESANSLKLRALKIYGREWLYTKNVCSRWLISDVKKNLFKNMKLLQLIYNHLPIEKGEVPAC